MQVPAQKTSKTRVQNGLKLKRGSSTQEYHLALLECRSALSNCQMASLRAKAERFSGYDKAHPFRLFYRRMRLNSHSTHRCLFL